MLILLRYHLNKEGRIVLTLSVSVKKDKPVIKTITSFFPSADIYERELMDLLGISVNGLAEGLRYPLADNSPRDEYPLRKDWVAGALDKEAPNA